VFGQIKNNLAPKIMISLQYHMETVIVGYDEEAQKDIKASKIVTDDVIPGNVEDIVISQEKARRDVRTRRDKADGVNAVVEIVAGVPGMNTRKLTEAVRERIPSHNQEHASKAIATAKRLALIHTVDGKGNAKLFHLGPDLAPAQDIGSTG
jgi:Cu/Ag efflux pump CusA